MTRNDVGAYSDPTVGRKKGSAVDGPEPGAGRDASEAEPERPAPIVSWEPPRESSPATGANDFSVGRLLTRTLDTYVAGFLIFVALATPGGVLAAILPDFAAAGILRQQYGLVIAGFLGIAVLTSIFGLASVIVASDLSSGTRPTVASAVRRAASRIVALLLTYLALALVVGGLGLVAFLTIGIAASLGNALIVGVAAALAVVIMVVFVVFSVRLSLITPVVALERLGPVATLYRTWAITRGHALALFGLLFVIGLIGLPLTWGASALTTSLIPGAGPVGLFVATVLTTPLLEIATFVAYRSLVGQPQDAPTVEVDGEPRPDVVGVPSNRSRRRALLGALIGGGILAVVVGLATADPNAAAFPATVPVADRGKILAGTSKNPIDPCRPGSIGSVFSSSDSIYIGGYFSRPLLPTESATLSYYVDGQLIASDALATSGQVVNCYYEPDPILDLGPGQYRIVVTGGQKVVAEGEFTIR